MSEIENENVCSVSGESSIELSASAEEGLKELIEKVDPLLAGRRLNRIIDVMSVVADVVDMTDDYMLEKLAKGYEESIGGLWNAGNVVRMATNEVAHMKDVPGIIGLIKEANTPDTRRGLMVLLTAAKIIGKQAQNPLIDD